MGKWVLGDKIIKCVTREGLIGGQGGGAGKKIIAGHRPKTDPKDWNSHLLTQLLLAGHQAEPEGYRVVTCLFLSIMSMHNYCKKWVGLVLCTNNVVTT